MEDHEKILRGLKTRIIENFTRGNVNYLKVPKDEYLKVAKYLKRSGFRRLLTVSAIDWIEYKKFEVYFIVHRIPGNLYFKVAADIPRDDPRIPSLSGVWPNAAIHERETWELFGIIFEGNEVLRPLFLEDWNGPPPFRKDFDWREYVKKTYQIPIK